MKMRALGIGVVLAASSAFVGSGPSAVIVASKPFGESYLLAEMFAQQLEARGIRVDRRPGLGATELAFRALRSGAIDVYPEYTGTGLLVLLGEPPRGTAADVYSRVAQELPSARGWRTRWRYGRCQIWHTPRRGCGRGSRQTS